LSPFTKQLGDQQSSPSDTLTLSHCSSLNPLHSSVISLITVGRRHTAAEAAIEDSTDSTDVSQTHSLTDSHSRGAATWLAVTKKPEWLDVAVLERKKKLMATDKEKKKDRSNNTQEKTEMRLLQLNFCWWI